MARQYYGRAIELFTASAGETAWETAHTIKSFAGLLRMEGKDQEAIDCFEKALGLFETQNGTLREWFLSCCLGSYIFCCRCGSIEPMSE